LTFGFSKQRGGSVDLFDVIKNRCSIRSFRKKPVEEEKIKKILEAAAFAPSAGNTQEWRFIKIKNQKSKIKIAEAALGQMFIAKAPIVIVLCADLLEIEMAYGNRGVEVYSLLDCGMAAQNLMLSATALGLGTCPVGGFDEEEVRKILSLPENVKPFLIIPIGYPAEKPIKRPRKSLGEIIINK
jgi:nitroreductase